jgi:DNA polymerase-3 subunit alpha
MQPVEIGQKEKLDWERELMGVYLSEHPFSAYASQAMAENDIVLCGQIDSEMEQGVVRIAGMVASVRMLTTRDGKASVSAVLEDMEGRVEVVAWPRVYQATREMWQEGNILLVQGRVKVKGDNVQVVVDSASAYELNPGREEEKVNMASIDTPDNQEDFRWIVLRLEQTQDEAGDLERLEKLAALLKKHPGMDRVNMIVNNGVRTYKMELPDTEVNYTPQLHQKLVKILGEKAVTVEPGNKNSH